MKSFRDAAFFCLLCFAFILMIATPLHMWEKHQVNSFESECKSRGGHPIVRKALYLCVDPKILK